MEKEAGMKPKLILLCITLLIIGCGQNPEELSGTPLEALKNRLEREIKDSGSEVGLAFKDLETGSSLFINAKEMMHAASTMKVPVMIEVFKQADQGKFSLEDGMMVRNEFMSIADGSPFSLNVEDDSDADIYEHIGERMLIKDLLRRMITVSSNLATNLMVELVEAKEVMATLEDLGVQNMQVLRGVEDGKAFRMGLNNTTDAYDLMLVMEAIASGKAGSTEVCQEMIDILSQQEFRAKIPAGLPPDVRVANKTGSITRIDHDAAIIFPSGRKPYVLVVLTRGLSDHQQAEALIALLSHKVYTFVMESE